MYQTYFEEMDELLQRAEECLIRLETGQSPDDINELFRIAHSIKGSSMMIGYEPIGNLTHKLEDLLDSVRKDRIRTDGDVLRLLFDSLDHVRSMADSKKADVSGAFGRDELAAADRLIREIELLLGGQAGPEADSRNPAAAGPAGGGIVGTLKEARGKANRRFFISVRFSDDAPMIQAVLYMIFHNIREIGSLEYTNISDDDIFASSGDRPVPRCEMILDTELEAAELYPYFDVMYAEGVEIIDLSEDRMRKGAVCRERRALDYYALFFDEFRKTHPVLFGRRPADKASLAGMFREQSAKLKEAGSGLEPEAALPAIGRFYDQCALLLAGSGKPGRALIDHLRREYLGLLEQVYAHVRGTLLFQIVKARDGDFGKRLREAAERMDRSRVRHLFVDVSGLQSLSGDGLRDLAAVRRDLAAAGIPVSIVAGRPMNRRMVNVFDSIRSVEHFAVYGTELDAVLGDPGSDRSGEEGGEMDRMDRYRIMIVDGEEAPAALRHALESAGCGPVDAFTDPGEALAAFRDRKYHIVLAEMDLPGMDGIEFLARVRQYDPMAQVIMMASAATVDRVLVCLELGANEFVLKTSGNEQAIAEAVARSAGKLERWKEAVRETALGRNGTEPGEE